MSVEIPEIVIMMEEAIPEIVIMIEEEPSEILVVVEEEKPEIVVIVEDDTPEIMVVVEDETPEIVLEIAEMAAPGPPGPPGNDYAGFPHHQTTLAASWPITHNLGRYMEPLVFLDDAPNNPVYPDYVQPDPNHTTIIFPSPVTGWAYF